MLRKIIYTGTDFLLITISIFIIPVCTPITQESEKKILTQTELYDTIDIIEPELELSDTVSEEFDTLALIDSLIQKAHSCCATADFSGAHALISNAINLIEQENGLPKEEWNDSNNFFIQIAELYTLALPREYLDSIPENITGMIFRYQLSISIDTMTLSPGDSSILFELECKEGLPYNIPIVRNKRVQKALYIIVNSRRRTMEKLLSYANYYIPFMEPLFAENGLPTDLVYLPILESGFNPKAYSYARASGIWQFIPSTGRIYGLRKNYWIDESRDPFKSTVAAINHLKKLHSIFNNWYLALAAYNCGENCIERAIKKVGTSDYWELVLPTETMNYVPQFIAYQIVAKNPQCFGLTPEPSDTFNLDTVIISDCVDLKKIAGGINITYEELKKNNPHILHWCTPPNTGNVTLYLPEGTVDTFKAFFMSLTDDDKVKWYRYPIKRGDNLLGISHRFKISVPAIKSINNLRGNRIVAGRFLYIPIPVSGTYPSQKHTAHMPHVSDYGSKNKVSYAQIFREKGIKPIKYRIRSGETLYEIAELFDISIEEICEWNNISNPRRVRAGKILTLYIEQPLPKVQKIDTQKKDSDNMIKREYKVKNGDNLYSIAKEVKTTVENLAYWNKKDIENPIIHPGEMLVYYNDSDTNPDTQKHKVPANSSDNTILYKVKKGDNISKLADLFSVDIMQILKLNNLKKTSVIKPGDFIRIPRIDSKNE